MPARFCARKLLFSYGSRPIGPLNRSWIVPPVLKLPAPGTVPGAGFAAGAGADPPAGELALPPALLFVPPPQAIALTARAPAPTTPACNIIRRGIRARLLGDQ